MELQSTRLNAGFAKISDAEGGISDPREMQRGHFKKLKPLPCHENSSGVYACCNYSSIPIGWILRLERRGCRFESGLLYSLYEQNCPA